jgi:hypothetical protein
VQLFDAFVKHARYYAASCINPSNRHDGTPPHFLFSRTRYLRRKARAMNLDEDLQVDTALCNNKSIEKALAIRVKKVRS